MVSLRRAVWNWWPQLYLDVELRACRFYDRLWYLMISSVCMHMIAHAYGIKWNQMESHGIIWNHILYDTCMDRRTSINPCPKMKTTSSSHFIAPNPGALLQAFCQDGVIQSQAHPEIHLVGTIPTPGGAREVATVWLHPDAQKEVQLILPTNHITTQNWD